MTEPQTFRKKPVEIQAVQFTADRWEQACYFLAQYPGGHREVGLGTADFHIIICTLEGDMRADLGDWIIRGVKGEFYPCKPDIFEQTYERVGGA